MRILLIEDDADLAANTADFLDAKGHQVNCADRVRAVAGLMADTQPELVILDLTLPDGDGLSIAESIRRGPQANVPILMLTARDTEADKLKGFDAGADDYLVKPFSLPELAARVTAIARRSHGASVSRVLRIDDLTLDLDTGDLTRAGLSLHLKPAAVKVLSHLMANTHRIVPREELEHVIWGDELPDRDLLRTHVYAIRKLVDVPGLPPLIETHRGVGYRIRSAT
ncbi:MAG: response regulator transcription factor [Pseudomonadota bacterium]|nr:response regulator transcription factor [Pseudomonadota bacterium]